MTRQHIVFLTGAGISAESGLSTFRGKDGLWTKEDINATAQREGIYSFNWPMMIDTMKTTTELCRLPGRGRGGYKWPKLIELAECLRIKTDDINLHDSSADVELTKRCFLYLLEIQFYNIKL